MEMNKMQATRIAWNFVENSSDLTEILIYDTIADKKSYNWWTEKEGTEVTPLSFRTEINAITTPKICIRINSGGGDVFAAEAIRTAILEKRQSGTEVKCKVDALCASAAVGIASACETIDISSSSYFMIHDPEIFNYGYYNNSELGQIIDMLGKVKQGIINAYAKKTGKNKQEIADLMTAETWYTGDEAVKEGFCDNLMFENADETEEGPIQNVVNYCFDYYKKMPEALKNRCMPAGSNGFLNISNNKTIEKGRNAMGNEVIKTADDLKAAYPEITAQIINDAVTKERARIQGIENIALPGYDSIINTAKFDNPINAGEVAALIIAEQKKQAENYISSREDDVKNSSLEDVGTTLLEGTKGNNGGNVVDAVIDKMFPANK
ncbi:MAG: Clp protease ClpP [Lachnospiraceae bacterium]|nr:Clp protease ClpP [Lachnospiraceae bacterium]